MTILLTIDRIIFPNSMKKSFTSLITVIGLSLSGCSMDNLPGVYSLDIQQGNIVNQEMIDQLRPNMTKRQVLYIMGSPMLVDIFHQKRWDYLYSEQPGGEPRVQKRVSLYFDGDTLIGVQGDFRPSSLPVAVESKESTVDIPPRNLDKTLFEMIAGVFSDEPDTQISGKRRKQSDDGPAPAQPDKGFDEPF